MMFQENWIYPGWITCFGLEDSPYEEGTDKDLNYYNNYLIPALVFLVKVFNSSAF
jgi:hypothetical protein